MYKLVFLSTFKGFTFGKLQKMFKGVARITLYVLICVPLFVFAFLITRQIQSSFRLRDSLTQSSSGRLPLADLQDLMAANELFTRSFFAIFFCFLMILCGLLITLKGTGNALRIARDHRVRYSLKTAYPGVVMSIAGCLLLTLSLYKSAQTNFETNKQLVALNQPDPIRSSQPVIPIGVDSVASTLTEAENTTSPGETSVLQTSVPIPTEVKQKSRHFSQPDESNTPPMPVSAEEVNWANQLAVRAITNGYTIRKGEKLKYLQIVARTDKDPVARIDLQLNWAFMFLMKTESGYQPSGEELDRYEEVVTRYVSGSPKITAHERDRAAK